jgi:hypothetical protein
MVVLEGDSVIDYLNNIKSKIFEEFRKSTNFESIIHTEMNNIIDTEIKFYNNLKKDKSEIQLNISKNGLPSAIDLDKDIKEINNLSRNDILYDKDQKYLDYDEYNKQKINNIYQNQ